MKQRDKEAIWTGIFAAVGLSAAGFFLGLRKLVWALWAVVSALWIILWLVAGAKSKESMDAFRILFIFGPPIVIFFLVLLLQGVMEAIGHFAGAFSSQGSAEGSRNQGQENQSQNAVDKPRP